MANEFLDNPIIQRSPKSQKEWIDFIFALSGFIATKGEVNQTEFSEIIPIPSDARVDELQLDNLHVAQAAKISELEKHIDELEKQVIGL